MQILSIDTLRDGGTKVILVRSPLYKEDRELYISSTIAGDLPTLHSSYPLSEENKMEDQPLIKDIVGGLKKYENSQREEMDRTRFLIARLEGRVCSTCKHGIHAMCMECDAGRSGWVPKEEYK